MGRGMGQCVVVSQSARTIEKLLRMHNSSYGNEYIQTYLNGFSYDYTGESEEEEDTDA